MPKRGEERGRGGLRTTKKEKDVHEKRENKARGTKGPKKNRQKPKSKKATD
jgi:hypothetical protein